MYQKEYDTSTPDFFTFQSGSIQILERTFVNLQQSPLHSNLVLFKSKSKDGYFRAKVLYIPIWFYSNFTCVYTINDITVLYIPIWFYSNAMTTQKTAGQKNFTFQSGSIQILNTIFDWSRFVPLHSNLVLFKLRTSNLIHLQQSLHSNLVLFKLCFRTTQN